MSVIDEIAEEIAAQARRIMVIAREVEKDHSEPFGAGNAIEVAEVFLSKHLFSHPPRARPARQDLLRAAALILLAIERMDEAESTDKLRPSAAGRSSH